MDTPVKTKRKLKTYRHKRTAQSHNKEIHFSQMATKTNRNAEEKKADKLHVFSEQVDRNVQLWLRNAKPIVETPVQPSKTVEKRAKHICILDTTNANICS